MSQLVTRIDDTSRATSTRWFRRGLIESRSDGVRTALRELIDRHRRRRIAEVDIAAYTARPQTEEELAGVDEAARRMIEEEPW
jgi:Arc/MetJ-type ribon-helix-helix transcriptional regulator